MKSVSVALAAHLEQELTTLATCWHLLRRDGVEFFFTDHDRNLIVDGNEYLCAVGYTRTAIENDVSLSVDNLDVMGFLDNETITDIDLRAGTYDYAEVFVFTVNWADLSQGILKQRRGWLGEVTMAENGIFKAELRGLTQALSQTIGEVYSPECRADLGDNRCKVPIQPDVVLRETFYEEGQFVRVATDPSSSGEGQAQYENRIYEVTTAGKTGVTQPMYDTTVGNTTTDFNEKATGLFTFTGQPSNAQIFTIGGKIYTMQTVLTNVDGHILISPVNFQGTVANILAALTLGAGAGITYAAATTAHPTVDFFANGVDKIDLIAKVGGAAGNLIGTTEGLTNAFFGGTTLADGWDGAIFTAREAWTRDCVITAVGLKATGLLTFTGQPANSQTVTIDGKIYTAQTVLTNVDGHFLIGGTFAETQENLLAALTLSSESSVVYAPATTAHPTVDAYQDAGTAIRLEAKVGGSAGNGIPTTETLNNASFAAGTLQDGTDDRFVLYIDVDEPRAIDGWYNGGAITFETGENQGRLIEIKEWVQENSRLTLFLPSPYPVQVGDTARIYPGCDKRLETCIGIFNNILNFRGEPYIPGQDDILKYPDAK